MRYFNDVFEVFVRVYFSIVLLFEIVMKYYRIWFKDVSWCIYIVMYEYNYYDDG